MELNIADHLQKTDFSVESEALNGVAKQINRAGRGYSFEALRARVLFRSGGIRPGPGKIIANLPLPWTQDRLPLWAICISCCGMYFAPIVRPSTMGPIAKRERPRNALMCETCRGRFGHSLEGSYTRELGFN